MPFSSRRAIFMVLSFAGSVPGLSSSLAGTTGDAKRFGGAPLAGRDSRPVLKVNCSPGPGRGDHPEAPRAPTTRMKKHQFPTLLILALFLAACGASGRRPP